MLKMFITLEWCAMGYCDLSMNYIRIVAKEQYSEQNGYQIIVSNLITLARNDLVNCANMCSPPIKIFRNSFGMHKNRLQDCAAASPISYADLRFDCRAYLVCVD